MLSLNNLTPYRTLFQRDSNGREINIYKLVNTQFYEGKIYYPNVIVKSEEKDVRPINETILSLKDVNFFSDFKKILDVEIEDYKSYFFFIYNTDNYYHFVYDTLPYLISFFELKKEIPNLKILMSYPNYQKFEHYKFVTEFLNLLSIPIDDITLVNTSTLYKNIYISNSYTHDGKSNIKPRNEIYDFYNSMVGFVTKNYKKEKLPTKIYVSRRTWISKDTSNIGTNYTTKRRLINEDEVVEYLTTKGFVEVFTENLSTIDKILLFNNAEHIIGPIGGGLCNTLFSNKKTTLTILNSPTFFDVNYRFLFSFENVNYEIMNISEHTEVTKIKKFMRVKFDDKVGEVVDIADDKVTINYSNIDLAGWNNEIKFEQIIKNIDNITPLDEGLNSEWVIDIKKLKEKIW
jgi:hypothetical protein